MIFKPVNYLFLNRNFVLINFKEIVEKIGLDVVLFSAHLSIAIKRLTINIQAKRSFGCHVGGQERSEEHTSELQSPT